MKKILALLYICLISSPSYSASLDEQVYQDKMIENLNLASIWVIEDGMSTYFEKGKDGIFKKLLNEWGVQLWVDPWIESDRYIDGFWVKARGINFIIANFHRETISNDLYEFWLVNIQGQDWSGEKNRMMFYITKTNDVYGNREILATNEQFIESYQTDEGTIIYFPVNDPQIMYEVSAWRFPENFRDSVVKEKVVVISESGEYKFVE